MLVYERGGVILAAGYEQHGQVTIHGHHIPAGHVCVLLTSAKANHKAPIILGDPEENTFLKKGGFYALPIKFIRVAKINSNNKVLLMPYVH